MMLRAFTASIKTTRKSSSQRAIATSACEPWQRTPSAKPLPENTTTGSTKKLSNGLTVISYPLRKHTAALSLFSNSGSRAEISNQFPAGVSHYLQRFAYKNNLFKFSLEVVREIEAAGADLNANITRESIGYHIEGLNTPQLIQTSGEMLRAVAIPTLDEWQLLRARDEIRQEVDHLSTNPHQCAVEALHRVAFGETGLGQSLFCPNYNIEAVDSSHIGQFMRRYYVPSNMVLVGTGVEMGDLEAIGNALFDYSETRNKPSDPPTSAPSKYRGGNFHVLGKTGDTTLYALVHGAPGLNKPKAKETLSILSALLGGAGVRKAERTPGSGVSGLLSTDLFNKSNGWVERTGALCFPYSDASLFGAYLQGEHGYGEEFAKTVGDILKRLSTSLSEADLARGKALAKAQALGVFTSLESVNEYLASQLFLGKDIVYPQGFLDSIDSVSLSDVKSFVTEMLKTEPSYVRVADVPQ